MNPMPPSSPARPSLLARVLKSVAAIEPYEVRAVVLSMLYFFFLFASYSVIKPVRDAMGTIYGVDHYQQLFTMTLVASLLFAPLYSGLAARIRLSSFLPWVYGFVALTIGASTHCLPASTIKTAGSSLHSSSGSAPSMY